MMYLDSSWQGSKVSEEQLPSHQLVPELKCRGQDRRELPENMILTTTPDHHCLNTYRPLHDDWLRLSH